MSSFPPDAGLSQPNSEENVAQRFPNYVFLLYPILFIKDQFFAGLSLSKFAYPLQKYPVKSFTLTERLAHFSSEISDWYDPDIFLSGYLSGL